MNGERSGGELVKVAFARDRIEGEMIHGLLEDAGIPSFLELWKRAAATGCATTVSSVPMPAPFFGRSG
jgi:hypothetical protein